MRANARLVNMTCSCGRVYTPAEFAALRFIGNYRDGELELEQRHCPCGSTLALERRLAVVTSQIAELSTMMESRPARARPRAKTCPHCAGHGSLSRRARSHAGAFTGGDVSARCPACGGSGRLTPPDPMTWKHPVGSDVIVTMEGGEEWRTKTRSMAFLARRDVVDDDLVELAILLEGRTGGCPLSRVRIAEQIPLFSMRGAKP